LFGGGQGRRLVAYLTVSTGTNAAYRTSSGKAVDLGLWGYRAHDGATVEEHTSGVHLARQARERIEASKQKEGRLILDFAINDINAISAVHVGQAWREGDPLATEIVENAARVLGDAIVEGVQRVQQAGDLSDEPEFLWITGGGVSTGLGQPFVDRIQAYVNAESPQLPIPVRVVLSDMPSNQRGVLGAAARAHEAVGLEDLGVPEIAPPVVPTLPTPVAPVSAVTVTTANSPVTTTTFLPGDVVPATGAEVGPAITTVTEFRAAITVISGGLPSFPDISSNLTTSQAFIVTPDAISKMMSVATFLRGRGGEQLRIEVLTNDKDHAQRIEAAVRELGLTNVRVHNFKDLGATPGEAIGRLEFDLFTEGLIPRVVTAWTGWEEITQYLGVAIAISGLEELKAIATESNAVWT